MGLTIQPLRRFAPVFFVGLALKLLLILLVVPVTWTGWFVPFLHHGALTNPLDPWSAHLQAGGDLRAFPYGLVMAWVLLPGVVLGALLGWLTGLPGLAGIGLGLSILALDTVLLVVIANLKPQRPLALLAFYWLSPLVFYICYWHGQLDIVPVTFLMIALLSLARKRPSWAGAMLGLAVASKLSMLVAVPFFLIYLFASRRLRPFIGPFAAAFGLTGAVFFLPVLVSPSARAMVLGTPEFQKIYDVAIPMHGSLEIYLLPVAYLLVLFFAWRVRRMSFELFTALMGVGFFTVVLLTPASPGWFLWVVPFLVLQLLDSSFRTALVGCAFSGLVIVFHLMQSSGAAIPLLGLDFGQPLGDVLGLPPRFASIGVSALIAVGLTLSFRLAMEGVLQNDYYRLSRRPLAIGIAGDSGTGKDTLAESLTGLFGAASVAHVSGDDYHLWDRHKPMWQVMTHLNPRANNLSQFNQDVLSLANGRPIRGRHYDHRTGRMTKPRLIPQNDVLIASGLHALFSPALCERFDVRIFLDMDESLRRYLKLQRDVHARGHSMQKALASIESRRPDREQFIQPQVGNADIIFRLMPLHPTLTETVRPDGKLPPLLLGIVLRQGAHYEELVRFLVGLCGMNVDVMMKEQNQLIEITVEDDISAEQIEMGARRLVPHLDELLDLEPVWKDGASGLMQIFVLIQTSHALRKRLS